MVKNANFKRYAEDHFKDARKKQELIASNKERKKALLARISGKSQE